VVKTGFLLPFATSSTPSCLCSFPNHNRLYARSEDPPGSPYVQSSSKR
jgi:hypothetical protein